MDAISIEEMKRMQLCILVDVAHFCEQHNIRYFLSGGSMLGAVRHQGFIPWDDDIDVQMPRPDYERFISEYHNSIFRVCCWEKDKQFLCTYAKVEDTRTILNENGNLGRVLGINIDIFPVDGLPVGNIATDFFINAMRFLWGLVVCATISDISKRSMIRKVEISIVKVFYKILPIKKYVTGLVIRTAQKYSFDNSEHVATVVWGYGKREVIKKSTATEYIGAKFEDYYFNIPKDYDDYLSHVYGDYMKLPPVEQQKYRHQSKAWWK